MKIINYRFWKEKGYVFVPNTLQLRKVNLQKFSNIQDMLFTGLFQPFVFFGWWIKPYVVYVSNFSIYLCMCSWFWKQQQNCKKKKPAKYLTGHPLPCR